MNKNVEKAELSNSKIFEYFWYFIFIQENFSVSNFDCKITKC